MEEKERGIEYIMNNGLFIVLRAIVCVMEKLLKLPSVIGLPFLSEKADTLQSSSLIVCILIAFELMKLSSGNLRRVPKLRVRPVIEKVLVGVKSVNPTPRENLEWKAATVSAFGFLPPSQGSVKDAL